MRTALIPNVQVSAVATYGEPAGYCACGDYVGPHHVCAPVPSRRCQYCGLPAEVFDVDGGWCSPECREYDRQSETTIRRRWQS